MGLHKDLTGVDLHVNKLHAATGWTSSISGLPVSTSAYAACLVTDPSALALIGVGTTAGSSLFSPSFTAKSGTIVFNTTYCA